MALFTELKSKNDDFDCNLKKLNQFITEDLKLVTYKWLSSELGVFYNQAQTLLNRYVRDQSCSGITVIYRIETSQLVDGVQRKTIQLVDSSRVNEFPEYSSIFVYSISTSEVKDVNKLYLVDYQMKQSPLNPSYRYQNVRCLEAKIKEETKIEPEIVEIKAVAEESTPPVKQEPKVQIKEETKATVKQEQNLMSMLKNAPPAKKKSSKKSSKKSVTSTSHSKKRAPVNIFSSDSEEDCSSVSEKPVHDETKKRRCMVFSDSEDGDESVAVPPSDEKAPLSDAPATVSCDIHDDLPTTSVEGVNLVKRLVSKTTTDPQGYMVTEKVWEWFEDSSKPKKAVPIVKKPTPKSESLTKKVLI